MKFLLMSDHVSGAHILYRLMQESNEVALFVKSKDHEDAWDGILPKVKEWKDFIDEDTIVFFDNSGMGQMADLMRENGIRVIGASSLADKLEFDRAFGTSTMQDVGIQVPQTFNFDSLDDAEVFVKEHKSERFVLKPSGDTTNVPAKLTYISQGYEDLLGYIDYIERQYPDASKEFELQEFVEGTAISTEGWFDGEHFVLPFNHTIENKKLLNGDLGPSVGCAGNIVWIEGDLECKILNEGLRRIEPILKDQYVGPIDLNTIVNEQGVYGLEFTARFGYDAISGLLHLYSGEIGKLFSDLFGESDGENPYLDSLASGTRLSIPPYPGVVSAEDTSHIPIIGVDLENPHFYFYEIMVNNSGGIIHSKGGGALMVVLGLGDTVGEAFESPLDVMDKLVIPDKQYRTDLGDVLGADYEKILEYENN